MIKYYFTFWGLVLGASLALAEPVDRRPLQEKISEAKYKQLIQRVVSQIPELQRLWRDLAVDGMDEHIQLAGGYVRGAAMYVEKQLERYTPEQIGRMKPSLKDLQLQNHIDLDFVVPNKERYGPTVETRIPGYFVDALGRNFYDASVESGGATIEKVLISPVYIEDPYDALGDLYRGELGFHWANDRTIYEDPTVQGNSRLTQALRYLRFTYDMSDDRYREKPRAIPPHVQSKLRRIAKTEKGKVVRSSKTDWWIEKGLAKLNKATGGFEETMKVLANNGLIPLLAELKYPLKYYDRAHHIQSIGFDDYIRALQDNIDDPNSKLSISDIKHLQLMHEREIGGEVYYTSMEAGKRLVKTAEDFLSLVEPTSTEYGDFQREVIDEFIENNLEMFFNLNPSVEDLAELLTTSAHSPQAWRVILNRAKQLVTTPGAIAQLRETARSSSEFNRKILENFAEGKEIPARRSPRDVYIGNDPRAPRPKYRPAGHPQPEPVAPQMIEIVIEILGQKMVQRIPAPPGWRPGDPINFQPQIDVQIGQPQINCDAGFRRIN